MGMAASQVRLLQLTSRKNDIGLMLAGLSNDKVSLSRDMQRVSKKYQDALSQKILKWSNNNGVSYVDLSYQNLMRPGVMNQNVPYLLTDTSGRIVVDSQYKKYAEMISPDGKSGGNWENNRTKILAELTGLDADKIDSYETAKDTYLEAKLNLECIKCHKEAKTKISLAEFLNEMPTSGAGWWINNNAKDGTTESIPNRMDESYANSNQGGDANFGTMYFRTLEAVDQFHSDLKAAIERMNWFTEEEIACFQTACDTQKKEIQGRSWDAETTSHQGDNGGDGTGRRFQTADIIDFLLEAYEKACSQEGISNYYSDGEDDFYIRNDKYDKWAAECKEAENICNNAFEAYSTIFTSEEVSTLNFYDRLFSSIAEKGWTYNNQVNNAEYLNQMLQNNQYTMTTVDREAVLDEKEQAFKYKNSYSTDIASNFSKIYFVNDTDIREQAMIEYEYEKSIINQKESRIDTRMKNLETEQSAINQMLQGLTTVKDDNIKRTMEIFG